MDLAVIILTANEKLHIGRCLEKLAPLVPKQIFVVDCFSTDGTQEIARSHGATVVEHAWPGLHAVQFNWALDHLSIEAKWVLRLDADEYLFPETIAEIKEKLERIPDEVTSLSLTLARVWQGHILKHGVGGVILTRFFRFGKGRCEERLMDEHIVTTEGRCLQLKGRFADDNLMDIARWTQKHVGYSLREALDLLRAEYGNAAGNDIRPEASGAAGETQGLNESAARKRQLKLRYAKLPLYWRSFAYFAMRYFLKGGFLDGKAGFSWHFLQGWWYRTLVDVRVAEIKKAVGLEQNAENAWARICVYAKNAYGIDADSV